MSGGSSEPAPPPPDPGARKTAPNRRGRRLGDLGQQEESTRGWMVSFTDLMGVMLTFFVLMFSMVEPGAPEFRQIANSLTQSLGSAKPGTGARGPADGPSADHKKFVPALDTSYLTALLRAQIGNNALLSDARVTRLEDGLVLSLPEHLLFAPGKSDVSYDGARALYVLADTLNRIRNRIELVGYAAPLAGEGPLGTNLWQLSYSRAAAVGSILQKAGYGRDIAIYGAADGAYGDLQGNDADRGKLARRVDIILRGDVN
jgi:chemotaxis protein MotB